MATKILTSAEMKARMADLESTMRRSARGQNMGAFLTLFIGIALLGGMGFYFYYGYQQIGGFLTPKTIVEASESMLMERVTPTRSYMESVVKENAPAWAEMASSTFIDNMPMIRQTAVTHATGAYEQLLDRSSEQSQTVVEEFIKKNESMIKEGVRRMAKGPKESEAFVTEIAQVFAKEAEVDINQLVGKVGDFLDGFNDLLVKTMNDGVRMTNLQAMLKEILMLSKRAILEQTASPKSA